MLINKNYDMKTQSHIIKITLKNDLSVPAVNLFYFYMKYFLSLHNQTNLGIVINHFHYVRDFIYFCGNKAYFTLNEFGFCISPSKIKHHYKRNLPFSRLTMCQTLLQVH